MFRQSELIDWYRRNRRRTRGLFDMLAPEAYGLRPISLRNPVVFYEGHLPAFSANTLLKKGLGHPAIDPELDVLFARGIDPESEALAQPRVKGVWPARAAVLAYGRRIDAEVLEALSGEAFERDPARLTDLAYTILEHEAMHQETMLYMWHELGYEYKRQGQEAPGAGQPSPPPPARRGRVSIPAGQVTLGADPGVLPFGWDNEFPAYTVAVPAFEIDVHNVSNGDFMAFVEAGGYRERRWWSAEGWAWLQEKSIQHPHFWRRQGEAWAWRGMFEAIPLPLDWPVYVSQVEAAAYARWQGSRLPSEAEYHRAAYGSPDGAARSYPWGEAPPDATRGNFDFNRWEPAPVGSYPAGVSAWGIHDLVGNGWEWTATPFAGHPGFSPMPAYPEYSADFFDNRHYVLKGASQATARELIRPSFRNWFRANYPYVYATFRTVSPSDEAGR